MAGPRGIVDNRPAMRTDLSGLVPASRLVTDPVELTVYECDGLPVHRQSPSAVVIATTREEVVSVVKWCATQGVPFVARGAGTGLSGGCTPEPGAIVIDLNRMNRILEIDPINRIAVVEPGVINVDLSAATAAHKLHYAPDPSSQTACTLGGNIAENAGGPHCLKYGVTADHVLGLEVVLPDGELARLGGPLADRPGLDLTSLFVGSEGTFGVATAITVRLTPNPDAVRTFLAIFDTMGDACRTVTSIIGGGIVPVALEILDRRTIRAIEASVNAAGYPDDAAAALLIELDGVEAGMDEEENAIAGIARENRALDFRAARDSVERLKLWKGRKSAFGTMGRVNTDLYVLDGVVPRTKLESTLDRVYEIADRHGVVVSNVFHAGDGNLHPNISYDGRDPDEKARVQAAGREILEACVEVGGTISGEHGIGSEKREFMPLVHGPDDLQLQRAIRRVIDPAGLANPGKMFPEEASGEAEDGKGVEREAARAPAGFSPERRPSTSGERDYLGAGDEILAPSRVEDAAEIVRSAEEEGHRIVPAGLGAHAGEADSAGPEIRIVSAAAFAGPVVHEPGDFTIGLGAGTPLTEVRDLLKSHRQEIPFDVPLLAGDRPTGGTIGGLVARGDAGPRSGSFGGLAPWVLGIEGVRGEGKLFRAGGMVVKNVAGYQWWKLAVGALGRIGLLTRVNFKLRPRPEATRLDLAGFESAESAWDFALGLRASGLEPVALGVLEGEAREVVHGLGSPIDEARACPCVVAWAFEGGRRRVEWLAAEAARRTAGETAPRAGTDDPEAARTGLGRLAGFGDAGPAPAGDLGIVRLSVRPGDARVASRTTADVPPRSGARAIGQWTDVTTGRITIRWSSDEDDAGPLLDSFAKVAGDHAGLARLVHLPPALRDRRARELHPVLSAALARRVIAPFDPRGVFARDGGNGS